MNRKQDSKLAVLLDGALEASIVGSFTRLGLLARRRLFGWDQSPADDLTGRVIVITGATSGLGLAAARELAQRGATVHLVGRNPVKTADVTRTLIAETGNQSLSYSLADMGELDQVNGLAAEIGDRFDRVDVLVQNAGALSADLQTNDEGMEQTVASQVLGPFLLTSLLLPLLESTPGSRVITVASGGMYSERLDIDGLVMNLGNYKGSVAYARAKRAQVALNQQWARRYSDSGVSFQAMHPGWADTPGVVESLPRFHAILGPALRTPAEGADTIVWLASDDAALRSNGKFWHDRRQRSTAYLPKTSMSDSEMDRLWAWCETRVAPSRTDAAADRISSS